MRRSLAIAALLLGLLATRVEADPQSRVGKMLDQEEQRRLDPTRCPGDSPTRSGPIIWDRKGYVDCAPTPTPGGGSGGSGSCTTQTLTRIDAETYSFPLGAPVTLVECLVDRSPQEIVTTTPGQNQVRLTGGQLKTGWFINAGAKVTCCGS